jgi:AbrB family transcriptional regulator (stage V sporulation protein T)
MRATGMVRRIDDLGRVVIPKEIRRSMRICEGDPLEIFLSEDSVCFKKYSALKGNKFATDIISSLHKTIKMPIIFTDTDNIIEVAGVDKEYCGMSLPQEMIDILNTREQRFIDDVQINDIELQYVIPIINCGDLLGGIFIVNTEKGIKSKILSNIELCIDIIENYFKD